MLPPTAPTNALTQGPVSQPMPQVAQPTLPQQQAMAQPNVNAPPPQPPPNPAQIKASVATNKLILTELTSIANNASVLANPDKLQKALLGLAADSRRSAGDDAGPVGASLAHVMSIMSDPRGPKSAIRDRIATVLQKLSVLDSYSRQKHGAPALQSPVQQSLGPGSQ